MCFEIYLPSEFSSKNLVTSYTCSLNDLETFWLKNVFKMFTGVAMVKLVTIFFKNSQCKYNLKIVVAMAKPVNILN